MSLWYRVCKTKDVTKAFSGEGGLHTSGRWNTKGKKIVYASQSIALATLEWLSHHGLTVSGFSYHKFSVDVPDSYIRHLTSKDLPSSWDTTPSTSDTSEFAEKILFATDAPLAITVPSVIVPEESNIIINPDHGDFKKIQSNIAYLGLYEAPQRQ